MKTQIEPKPLTLARYFELLDECRMLARLGRVITHEESAPIAAEMRKVLRALTPAEIEQAKECDWRRDPALFDAREAQCIRDHVRAEMRPRMSFRDIPQFPRSAYEIDVTWSELERHLAQWQRDYVVDLNPDFQRPHVWSSEQQTAYIEYQLQGGEVGKSLIFNHPFWNRAALHESPVVIVDGKQRLEAVRAFLRGEVAAFDRTFKQFAGRLHMSGPSFRWRVVALETREALLRLYLNINAGGTPHTASELSRVRNMLEDEATRKDR